MSDSPLPPLLPGLLSAGIGPGATPALPEMTLLPAGPAPAADATSLARFANLLAGGLQPVAAPLASPAAEVAAPGRVGATVPAPSSAVPAVVLVADTADPADPQPDGPAASPSNSAAEEAALAMAALAGGLAPTPALPSGPLSESPSPAALVAGANGPATANLMPTATATAASGEPAQAALSSRPATLDGSEFGPLPASLEASPGGGAGSGHPPSLPASDVAATVPGEIAFGVERQPASSSGGGIAEPAAGAFGAVPSAGQPAPAPAAERAVLPLPDLAERQAWSESLGERLTWLVRGELEQAQLELNPPELGRLDVRLRLQADQASVSFASGAPEVREALEQALPRLREMLAEAGIELADAQVGAHPRDREPTPERTPGSDAADELESAMPAPAEPTDLAPAVHGTRLIDRFV